MNRRKEKRKERREMKSSQATMRHGSDLSDYLREVQQENLLTWAEEQELSKQIHEGNLNARQRMVQANLRLVIKIASDFVGRGLSFEDLISEGNLGLIRAAQEYDPNFGTRFSTYASYWVKQSIHHALINTGGMIRLPAHMFGLLSRWKRAEQKLLRTLERPPLFEEVARELGMGDQQKQMISHALRAMQVCRDNHSGETDASAWLPEDAADHRENPEQSVDTDDEIQNLRKRFIRLDERERNILALRYGLGGVSAHTIKQVADSLGVTREWVRRLELRALAKLATAMNISSRLDLREALASMSGLD